MRCPDSTGSASRCRSRRAAVGGHLATIEALVLVVCPAEDATLMALFRGPHRIRARLAPHPASRRPALAAGASRAQAVRAFLEELRVARGALRAVVARAPEPAGVREDEATPLANGIAAEWGCRALAIDPARFPEAGDDELLALALGASRILSGA
jgi:hypothetical protein